MRTLALTRRLAWMLRQTQGAFTARQAAFKHVGDSRLFYPSGGYKPMVWLTILMVRTNAAPGFLSRPERSGLQGCHRTP